MDNKFRKSLKFSISIAVITFVLAAIFSIISSSVLTEVVWGIGLIIVLLIVFTGVVFDMLGIAATAASEPPFHAMAAEKIPGAKEAIIIVRNADRFASFCNDVIGDISGIVSGTATAVVVIQLANVFGHSDGSTVQITLSVVLTSIVAALTVGGKAVGKFLAIHSSTKIIFMTARVIAWIESNFKINILSASTKSTRKSR
ncbi:hypothetical protein GCM10010954_03540 [Halobacillus andaensis]|uniref:CNNM transmembrane domain-containing protein n=1 Tax=Halobacillus andaensis TaxID=1176239 RepID=A0A917AZI9_HALAA|nr:hypothetical protein [Halobacillus andaensis]MBP2003143.1 CBS domain containing-hemolysin-like protein [Halobacillus andaensis]GGF08357.1 hypothetical protein GCM10010954_03540 [Halobacillus andaensis]